MELAIPGIIALLSFAIDAWPGSTNPAKPKSPSARS
jgi:hypothetical protein